MVDDSSHPFNSYPVLKEIENRCGPYGIHCRLDNDDAPYGPASVYLVWEEEGIDTAQIVDGPHARFAASVPFEHYRESFLGYRARWSQTVRIVKYNVEACYEMLRSDPEIHAFAPTPFAVLGSGSLQIRRQP